MAISPEQGAKFIHETDFNELREVKSGGVFFHGKEAFVKKVDMVNRQTYAFKWYASLAGQPVEQLLDYVAKVRKDEALLLAAGLKNQQVPKTHFYVAHFDGNPQLFGVQRWLDGQNLREIPFLEIIRNPLLRRNLADLFLKCSTIYPETGRFPDLTGGKRINLFGRDVVEPFCFFWPFRTTNIMIEGDLPVIADAKTNQKGKGIVLDQLLKTHRLISIAFGKTFQWLDKN